MSALSIQPTYPIFTDIDGQPLEDGYVWIGVANLAPIVNPITVYWDAALTIPAAQPIRTQGGYPVNSGTPARLYVNSNYSIQVQNKNGSVVYSAPAATERYSDVVIGSVDASSVSYLSSFAGSIITTVKNFLDRIISLNNGNPAHTDGVNTITGSPRWFIGNNAPSTDDSALLIGRGLTGSYSSGAHAVRDETTYASSGSGLHAYASFDAIPTLTGSVAYNHLHAFQARPAYSGSGPMDQLAGFTFQANHTGAGTITSVRGFRISDTQGAGPIANQYGLWFDGLTRGTSGNFAIFSASTSLPSYHGGKWQMGTAPQIDVAGFKTAYGGLLSVDTNGNVLPNPNLTIINGVMTMAAAVSKIEATISFNLQLDAVGIVESKKPHKFPVYTVATLPSPASAYTYCRAFVSDSNATMTAGIGAVVAGGGANKVPVYSDGANWCIG